MDLPTPTETLCLLFSFVLSVSSSGAFSGLSGPLFTVDTLSSTRWVAESLSLLIVAAPVCSFSSFSERSYSMSMRLIEPSFSDLATEPYSWIGPFFYLSS